MSGVPLLIWQDLINGAPPPGGGSVPDGPIDLINVSFQNSQRTSAPVSITATTAATVRSWLWEVFSVTDPFTKTLYTVSFAQNPIFIIPDVGFYDIRLTVKNGQDQYTRRWDDAFVVQLPQFTEAEADEVVDITSANFFHDYANADKSDYKIFLKGTGTHYFQPYQLRATDGHPVRIQVDPTNGCSITTPAGVSQGFWLNQCDHIRVDGFLANGSNGLNLQALDPNTAQVFMAFGVFTEIQLFGANVYMDRASMTSGSAAIAFIPGTPDATNNSATYLSRNNAVYRCSVTQAKDEGLYFMFNNDDLQAGFRPIKSFNPVLARNSFTNTGRDGMQVASSINARVHDNYINTCGLNHTASQESIISWNGGNSNCLIYNNIGVNSEMLLNIQSGNKPMNTFAGETSPGPVFFFNNVLHVGTYTPGGSTEPDAIYIQNESSVAGTGTWAVNFFNNTIFSEDRWNAESFSFTGSFAIAHKWYNNIIVKFGTNSGRSTPELNLVGPNNNQTILRNNIVRDYPTVADLLFTSVALNDFSLSSFSSVAYGGSPTDIAAAFPTIPNLVDYLGFPMLAPGQQYTFGAYSGYQKRMNTPSTGDPNPATFTTPVTVTSLTQSGGTLGYESNKIGLLYYIASTTDVAPSKAQIRAGLQSNGTPAPISGSLVDVGTVSAKVISGGNDGTTYYLFCLFVTIDNVEQSLATRLVFTTTADVTAPTLSSFAIQDANRDRIYFNSSEPIQATTFSHFTVATPTRTITAVFINTGLTTGHYFTVSAVFLADDAPTIAYAGSDNFRDLAASPNNVASFGAVAITNGILPAAAQDVVWVNGVVAPTIVGNNITATAINDNARSSQIIPSASNGYAAYDFNAISRSNFQGARYGLILANNARTFANIIIGLDVRANNVNVDIWEGTTFKATLSNGQGTRRYRFLVNRTTGKVLFQSSTTSPTFPDNSYTTHYTLSGTVSGDLRAAVVLGTSGLGIVNALVQANQGLQ